MEELTIYTGSVELMQQTLNGTVRFFSSTSSLWSVLAGAALLGLFILFTRSWLDSNAKPAQTWIFTLIAVFMLSVVKVNVNIKTIHDNYDAPALVDDVPAISAIPAWFFSQLRYVLLGEIATSYGDVENIGVVDPLSMLMKMKKISANDVSVALDGYADNIQSYINGCVYRDLEVYEKEDQSVNLNAMRAGNPKSDGWLDHIKVDNYAWMVMFHEKDGDSWKSKEITCAESFTKIKAFLISEDLTAILQKVLLDKGIDSAVGGVAMNAIGQKMGEAPLEMWEVLKSQYIKEMMDNGIMSDMDIAIYTQFAENRSKQNASDILQAIFSAENTQMLIIFLELATVVLVPLLMVIALLTGKLDVLLFGGNFAFTALVTSFMYMPIKLIMLHYYVEGVGVGVPTSWVQMGSIINDAESAVARAAALTMMVPAFISMLVNKLFQGASAAGSALSAANKISSDTSKIAPTIASGADAGKVSEGNRTFMADTATGPTLSGNYNALQTTSTGNSPTTTTVGTGINATAGQGLMQADEKVSSAQQALTTSSTELANHMSGWARQQELTGTQTSDSKTTEGAIHNLATQISKSNNIGMDKAYEQAGQLIASAGVYADAKVKGGLDFFGTGFETSAGGKASAEAKMSFNDKLTELLSQKIGKSDTEDFSQQGGISAVLTALTSKSNNDTASESGGVNTQLSEVAQATESYSSAQKEQQSWQAATATTSNLQTTGDINYQAAGSSVVANNAQYRADAMFGSENLDGLQRAWEASGQGGNISGAFNQRVNQLSNDLKSQTEYSGLSNDMIQGIASAMAATEILNTISGNNKGQDMESIGQEHQAVSAAYQNLANVTGQTTQYELAAKASGAIAEAASVSGKDLGGLDVNNNGMPTKQELDGKHKDMVQQQQQQKATTEQAIEGANILADFEANRAQVEQQQSENEAQAAALLPELNHSNLEKSPTKETINEAMKPYEKSGDASQQEHLENVKDGLGILATSSESEVMALLNGNDNKTKEDIYSAMGAIGEAVANDINSMPGINSEQLSNNLDAVKDYLNQNKSELVFQANSQPKNNEEKAANNALTQALVNADSGLSVAEERASVAALDEGTTTTQITSSESQNLGSLSEKLDSLGIDNGYSKAVSSDSNATGFFADTNINRDNATHYFDGLTPSSSTGDIAGNSLFLSENGVSDLDFFKTDDNAEYMERLKDTAYQASAEHPDPIANTLIAQAQGDETAIDFMKSAAGRLEADGLPEHAQRLADNFGFDLGELKGTSIAAENAKSQNSETTEQPIAQSVEPNNQGEPVNESQSVTQSSDSKMETQSPSNNQGEVSTLESSPVVSESDNVSAQEQVSEPVLESNSQTQAQTQSNALTSPNVGSTSSSMPAAGNDSSLPVNTQNEQATEPEAENMQLVAQSSRHSESASNDTYQLADVPVMQMEVSPMALNTLSEAPVVNEPAPIESPSSNVQEVGASSDPFAELDSFSSDAFSELDNLGGGSNNSALLSDNSPEMQHTVNEFLNDNSDFAVTGTQITPEGEEVTVASDSEMVTFTTNGSDEISQSTQAIETPEQRLDRLAEDNAALVASREPEQSEQSSSSAQAAAAPTNNDNGGLEPAYFGQPIHNEALIDKVQEFAAENEGYTFVQSTSNSFGHEIAVMENDSGNKVSFRADGDNIIQTGEPQKN